MTQHPVRSMDNPGRPRSAFTLVELMIVAAIISILAIIAVPNFLESQTRAKVSRAKADLRNNATAISAYTVDHNRVPPVFGPAPPVTFPWTSSPQSEKLGRSLPLANIPGRIS